MRSARRVFHPLGCPTFSISKAEVVDGDISIKAFVQQQMTGLLAATVVRILTVLLIFRYV
jgi:hypothetical protein